MTRWTWSLVVVFGLVLAAIVAMFGLTDDVSVRTTLLGYLDTIVLFVVGTGAGAAAGGSVGFLKGTRAKLQPAAGALGTDWTWPLVVVIALILAAIVALFALTDDASMQARLVEYFGAVVPFVLGAGVGAATGGVVGYLRGYE